MNNIFIFDGIKVKLEPADLDKDGAVGGVETIRQKIQDEGILAMQQPTELGESLKELNMDGIDPNTKMSGIDLRSRLHPIEISNILAVDYLISSRFLPNECVKLTMQKKRLSVSEHGKGRTEIIDLVGGKKEQDAKATGFGERIKGFLGGKPS